MTRIRRLTRSEIKNTLADLLGDTAAAQAATLEPDTRALGFSTGDDRGMSSNYVDLLKRAAETVATGFKATIASPAFAATCFTTDAAARTCADTFLRDFGARAYRRPLVAADVTALLAVYDAGRDTGIDGNFTDRFKAGMDYTMRSLIQSPEFIFRTELGAPGAAAGAITALTDAEVASAISYSVIASPPDTALRAAAEAGQLKTAAQIEAQVRRLITAQPDRFKAQVQQLVLEWLGIDYDKPIWTKSTTAYPSFTPALKTAFQQQTAMFIDDWTATGSALPKLLTSADMFMNSATAPMFGVTATSAAFQKQALDPTQRAGILTTPAFLGTYAHSDGSSPVFRGVAIMRKFLCSDPPPPPANIPPLPPADNTVVKTTRQRYAQHTSAAFCATCHKSFDPMGMTFENYDGIGAYRTQENGVAIDASGAIVGTQNSNKTVANAVELAQALAASSDVYQCFSRQVFRFSMGRKDAPADACAIQDLTTTFSTQGLDLRELIVGIATAPGFVARQVPAASP